MGTLNPVVESLTTPVTLPDVFCWSKMGTEAGESLTRIRQRKDVERVSGGGTFYWGIGNSIRPSVTALLQTSDEPAVVFTRMISKPAARDINPRSTVRWRKGRGLDGTMHNIPESAVVTSSVNSDRPRSHYALVCFSESTIVTDRVSAAFSIHEVLNFVSGSRVGSSQVTSVVSTRGDAEAPPYLPGAKRYAVAFVAKLRFPYLLRLEGAEPCH